MTAIAATSYTSRILVDGTLAMTIHIDPPFRDAAIALFGAPGSEMALAALQCATAAPKPAGGERAKWCGIRCQETEFQRWIQERYLSQWEAAPGATPATWAASVIRAVCSVESRAELDNDPAAAERFDRLIRRPYLEQAK